MQHYYPILWILLTWALFSNGLFAQNKEPFEQKKAVIAVMDLKTEGDLKSASSILSDRLRAELFNTGQFAVMERGEMDAILKEQGFQQSGVCDDKACMVEVGQLLGVQKMVAGSIGQLGAMFLINLRIIDVSTGKMIATYSGECRCPVEELGNAMKTAAMNLAGDKSAPPPTTPAVVTPPPQPVAVTAVPAPIKSVWNNDRWFISATSGWANSEPEFNEFWNFYMNPGISAHYRLISNDEENFPVEDFGKFSITLGHGIGRFLNVHGGFSLMQGSSQSSFTINRFLMDPSNSGNLNSEITVNNKQISLGLTASPRFGFFRLFIGLEGLLFISDYSLSTNGNFNSTTTNTDLGCNLDLGHTQPGFGITSGFEFLLGKHIGLAFQSAYYFINASIYEGGGDMSKLENLLFGRTDAGESDYVLRQGDNLAGESVIFLERKNSPFQTNTLTNIQDQEVDLSHFSLSGMLTFYF
ncbi:MAG: hypothetical protein A2293_15190 [Elusimicrobia bacterium RIFOXYB2_FULL_49_7]|nr:MAG: hypothetical protein A2293_15190 [Elusimicrobia bacterium RIFOXYB2_FULL_49_7]